MLGSGENMEKQLGVDNTNDGNLPLGPISIALVLLTCALWGATPVAIRFSAESFPPVMLAAVRFAIAAMVMLIWCYFEGTKLRIETGQFTPILIAGLLLFPQISLFNAGVYHSNASHGSAQVNTFVFWVIAIEHLITRNDRLNGRRLAGLVVAFVGAALIFADADGSSSDQAESPTMLGDALLLASAFVLGIKIVYVKHAVRTVEPGKLIFWHDILGVGMFLAYSGMLEDFQFSKLTVPAIMSVLYQGIFVAGFCFAIQATLLRKHSATRIAIFSFTTPIFGVLFAVLLRGDRLSPSFLVAAACIVVGILLVNLAPQGVIEKGKSADDSKVLKE